MSEPLGPEVETVGSYVIVNSTADAGPFTGSAERPRRRARRKWVIWRRIIQGLRDIELERHAKLGPMAASALMAILFATVALLEHRSKHSAPRPLPRQVVTPPVAPANSEVLPTPADRGPNNAAQLVSFPAAEQPARGRTPLFNGADDPSVLSSFEREIIEESLKTRLRSRDYTEPAPPPPADEAADRLVTAGKALLRTVSDVTGGTIR